MLHLFAFTMVSMLLLSCAAGLTVMLSAARDDILRALRLEVETPPVRLRPERRVRVVNRTRTQRLTPSLRAAA